jgi:hypothetical protein
MRRWTLLTLAASLTAGAQSKIIVDAAGRCEPTLVQGVTYCEARAHTQKTVWLLSCLSDSGPCNRLAAGTYTYTVLEAGRVCGALAPCHLVTRLRIKLRASPHEDVYVALEQPPQPQQPEQPQQAPSPKAWLRSRGFGNTPPAQIPSPPKSSHPSQKDKPVSTQTIELPIEGSNCFYLSTDFDTGLPLDDARVCVAESRPQMTNGEKVTFVLSCDARLATCMQLSFGQTYDAEAVNSGQYPECGKASEKTTCVKVHARPYDLIYTMMVRVDCNDKANQSPGTAAYEDCRDQK